MSIPTNLINEIKEGNLILFLGAGSSFDCIHSEGVNPPTGAVLSTMIAKKFLDKRYHDNDNLQYIADLAINQKDLVTVQKFIADIFRNFKAGEHHREIPLYRWKNIYTTNYDQIIENAYQTQPNRVQELATIIKNGERIRDKVSNSHSVMYNKLHGCINEINDLNLPLILTPDQYIDYRENRSRLFERLKEDSYEYPILFVGYSFADWDIRFTLKELEKLKSARPRSFMLGPSITDEEQILWESKKISSIKMSFKDFMISLKSIISDNDRKLSSISYSDVKHPIQKKLINSVKEPSQRLFDYLTNDVVFIHQNLAEKNSDPKQFYKGYFNSWDPIMKNFDVERHLKDDILSEVFLVEEDEKNETTELYLIKGNAGSGKTVLMKRLAWDASVYFNRLCLFLKPEGILSYDAIEEICSLSKERVYLFIDGITSQSDDLLYVLKRAVKDRLNLTIIGSDRTNIWNIEGVKLNGYLTQDYTLTYLNNKEIDGLLGLLTKYDSLGYLEDKTKDEQKAALEERHGRELLVALYEATSGKPFEDMVMDEYNSIPNDEAKAIYLTICLFHRVGARTRAGVISRLHGVSFSYFKERLFYPLESVVSFERNYRINDFEFKGRHQYISELVVEQVLVDLQSRLNEYLRLVTKLDVDYDSDRRVFIAITKAKDLISFFKDTVMIRAIYKAAYENVGPEPSLMQQEAIFEMSIEGGSLEKASTLLNQALERDPNNQNILHSKAELELRRAEKANQSLLSKKYLQDSKQICQKIIGFKKSKDTSHAYHTLLKVYLKELSELLDSGTDELIDRKIQDFEKTLNTALQAYPKQEFLYDAESNFNNLLNNKPKALASLINAQRINNKSAYLGMRLSNYYIQTGKIDHALRVLEETIQFNQNNKDLNYRYAMLLQQKSPEDYINIKHYLRKAFTKGDKRYEAQFWYARTLFLLGEKQESLEYFENLKEASLDYRTKRTPNGMYLNNNIPKIFEGTVMKVEASFGFVRRDVTGDVIYFHRPNLGKMLNVNQRVKFNLAFNYSGPVAVIFEN